MSKPATVEEIMTSEVSTLEHDANLLDASLLMRRTGFRHFPVVKNGAVVGIVSDRDIIRATPSLFGSISQEEYNRVFESTPIEKVMTADPLTVQPGTPLTEAVDIMAARKIGALPVVNGEKKLVGVVTRTDLLRLLRSFLD